MLLMFVPILVGVLVFFLTRNSPKSYQSQAKVYTGIASGYSIESLDNGNFNYFAINNAFDNLVNLINSRSTIEETGLKLFALHISQQELNPQILSEKSFNDLAEIVPEEVFKLVDPLSLDQTYENLVQFKDKNKNNFVYELVNLYHKHYSFNAISKIKVNRVGNSDLLEIEYTSDDPAVSYQTVRIIIDVFIEHYSSLKENQTDAVVNYFNDQLEFTARKLSNAEDSLLIFNMNNKIINYYEQTKHVASQIEKYELEKQSVTLDFEAAKSVIEELELKAGAKNQRKLQGENILNLRNHIFKLSKKISSHQLETNKDQNLQQQINAYEKEHYELKQELYKAIDSLHLIENSLEGVNIEEVINNWLDNIIAFEETRAKLKALEERKIELDNNIMHFAPLGANLKKIERKIDVIEKEYLTLLHNLGLAKLKQQNNEMSSNIKIVDAPELPIDPIPSKRKVLLIAATLAGFIIVFALIILIYFLDATLRNIDRSTKATKLNTVGAYPQINTRKINNIYDKKLKDIALNMIINNLIALSNSDPKEVYNIGFLSIYEGEGKTTILKELERRLIEFGGKNISFNMIEFDALRNNIIPIQSLKNLDLACLIVRADRSWGKADNYLVEMIKQSSDVKLRYILNGMKTDQFEDYTGQVPAKRSFLRVFIKRLVMLRFFESFETTTD